MGFRAEILLLCAEILPFLGSVQKYYYPGTRGGWILVQGHFWGMCRYIHFWRNIHLCSSVTNTLENIECFQYSHTLQRSYLILGHRGLCWVKTQQVDHSPLGRHPLACRRWLRQSQPRENHQIQLSAAKDIILTNLPAIIHGQALERAKGSSDLHPLSVRFVNISI